VAYWDLKSRNSTASYEETSIGCFDSEAENIKSAATRIVLQEYEHCESVTIGYFIFCKSTKKINKAVKKIRRLIQPSYFFN